MEKVLRAVAGVDNASVVVAGARHHMRERVMHQVAEAIGRETGLEPQRYAGGFRLVRGGDVAVRIVEASSDRDLYGRQPTVLVAVAAPGPGPNDWDIAGWRHAEVLKARGVPVVSLEAK